jgi:hypothetical protein
MKRWVEHCPGPRWERARVRHGRSAARWLGSTRQRGKARRWGLCVKAVSTELRNRGEATVFHDDVASQDKGLALWSAGVGARVWVSAPNALGEVPRKGLPLQPCRNVAAGSVLGTAMAWLRVAESATACQRVVPWLVQVRVACARVGTWFPGWRHGRAGLCSTTARVQQR